PRLGHLDFFGNRRLLLEGFQAALQPVCKRIAQCCQLHIWVRRECLSGSAGPPPAAANEANAKYLPRRDSGLSDASPRDCAGDDRQAGSLEKLSASEGSCVGVGCHERETNRFGTVSNCF